MARWVHHFAVDLAYPSLDIFSGDENQEKIFSNRLYKNKILSFYCRESELQGALVLAKSERLELRDNILRTL